MTPEEGITEVLEAAGLGEAAPTANPWPIFEGQFPEETSQCILVKVNGGRQPEVRIAIDYPSLQILVRSSKMNYVAARDKAQAIFDALQGIPSAPAAYPELTSVVAVNQPIFVGYEQDAERPVWSLNFNTIISKAPVGHRDL
jgi:hypothetical protein